MVTVFTKDNCQPCRLTLRKLDSKGVEYRVRNIEEDPTAISEIKELGYLQAPVVVTDNDHWSGLNPTKLDAL